MASPVKPRRVFRWLCLLTVLGFMYMSLCGRITANETNSFVSSLLSKIYKDPATNIADLLAGDQRPNTKVLELSDPNKPSNGTYKKAATADHNGHGNSAGRQTSTDHQELPKNTDVLHSDPLLSPSNPMVKMMHKLEPSNKFVLTNGKTVRTSEGSINSDDEMKVILMWTKLPSFGLGHEPFIQNNCPVSNCMTTSNRSLVKQSSAIAIHPTRNENSTTLPRIRYPNQTYIIHLTEAPARFKFPDSFDGVFDITMAYRADADIPVPYGIVTTGDSSWRGTSEQLRTLITGKTKLVAWFVSNCKDTPSMRGKYVTELQRYIPVDIYGACGPLNCTRASEKDCLDMLERDYKFYIAFENSVCTEYITEKAYKYLQRYIVPVVYGGANYSLYTPPYSVINVRDFNSPKHLAMYLKELAEDEQRYREYFNWKKRYSFLDFKSFRAMGVCKLCELLHEPKREKPLHKKLWDWWFNGTCSEPITVT